MQIIPSRSAKEVLKYVSKDNKDMKTGKSCPTLLLILGIWYLENFYGEQIIKLTLTNENKKPRQI